jgi:hypothetical protein
MSSTANKPNDVTTVRPQSTENADVNTVDISDTVLKVNGSNGVSPNSILSR